MILISQRPTTWLTVRYLDTRRGNLGTASDRGRRAIFSEAKLLVGLAGPNATTHPLPRSWAGSDREPQGGRAGLPRGVAEIRVVSGPGAGRVRRIGLGETVIGCGAPALSLPD